MTDRNTTLFLVLVSAVALAGCGGSGGGISGEETPKGLVLIDVSVAGFDGVPLNEIIEFEFSEVVNPDTIRADTIQIREGPNYGKQVPGYFRVDGNKVFFYPRLAILPDLADAGLQPGKPYRITLPGSPKVATVRSFMDDRLERKTVENFQTALTGSTNLFIDNFLDPLPPRITFMNPPDGAKDVPADSKITLTFNRRPLHPATVTSTNIKLTMIKRLGVDVQREISGTPVITQSHESVSVEFVPTFPLADDATYKLDVDRRVQDMVGNDIIPYSATFSVRDEPFRYSQVSLTFDDLDRQAYMDESMTTASWNEAVEEALAALFTVAGGNGTAGDLRPTSNQNFTPDDFKRGVLVVEEDGIEYDVYNFRTIEIPENVTVRFSQRPGGPNRPVKLLALKPVKIDGVLTVSGGDGTGENSTAYSSSKLPKLSPGGAAGPGGGDGADNYTGTGTQSGVPKMNGEDVLFGGEGGQGGETGTSYYSYGGGGGGAGHREGGTDGKAGGYSYYPTKGGKGGKSAVDRGYPLNEERKPNVGGAGGAAGGHGFYYYTPYRNGAGSGGGGGGALTVQSAGSVSIGSQGRILARGGNGGHNYKTYYCGGAGGGAAGGGIVVRATSTLNFSVGSAIDVAGGVGGQFLATYSYYSGGQGGNGGDGYIRLEALEDENSPGKPMIEGLTNANLTYTPVSQGVFAPKGGGAPSVGQTVWINLGVYDPQMVKPSATDIVATLFNDTLSIEVQMAVDDSGNLGSPDLNHLDTSDLDGDGQTDDTLDVNYLSEWTKISNIESLNGYGYQYVRVRMTFQLDPNQTVDQPLPFLDLLRMPFKF